MKRRLFLYNQIPDGNQLVKIKLIIIKNISIGHWAVFVLKRNSNKEKKNYALMKLQILVKRPTFIVTLLLASKKTLNKKLKICWPCSKKILFPMLVRISDLCGGCWDCGAAAAGVGSTCLEPGYSTMYSQTFVEDLGGVVPQNYR